MSIELAKPFSEYVTVKELDPAGGRSALRCDLSVSGRRYEAYVGTQSGVALFRSASSLQNSGVPA
jgi:hypothetical protein